MAWFAPTTRSSLIRAGIAVGSLVLAASLILIIVKLLYPDSTSGLPKPQLPTVILLGISFAIGTILLLALLLAFAFVGRAIDGDKAGSRGALSLPHGSISAVLALLILVVFSLTSVHMFTELRAGEDAGVESRGVTQEALAALPDDRVLAIQPEPAVPDQPQTYVVKLSNPHATSTDFAKELTTIFSTLLIAIIGFYFGQGATAAGAREVTMNKETRDKPNTGGEETGTVPSAQKGSGESVVGQGDNEEKVPGAVADSTPNG